MPAARAERLRSFIEECTQGPVVWGESDCCALPARWIERETGCKLALPRYSSKGEAHRLIREAGGLLPLVVPVLARASLTMTDKPEIGDVCIVRLSDHDEGAICCGNGVVIRRADPGGTVYFQPKDILRAWTV